MKWFRAFTVMAATTVLALTTVPASAAPDDTPTDVLVASGTAPMEYAIDEEAAAAAGQTVIKDEDGTSLYGPDGELVINLPSGETQVSPFNTVWGSCGSAYYDIYRTTGLGYKVQTGFAVNKTAWWADWETAAYEMRGDSTVGNLLTSEHDPMSGYYYNKTYYDSVGQYGTSVSGRVTTGKAWIVGGLFCVAGYPFSYLYI